MLIDFAMRVLICVALAVTFVSYENLTVDIAQSWLCKQIKQETAMQLVKYRDAGMNSYTWFYVNEKNIMVSPYFDTEESARAWFDSVFDGELEPNLAA